MKALVDRLWRADRPLTVAGFLMLASLVPIALGMWLDPRIITGAPAWLKPAKFAFSLTIYCFTLAWVFTYLPTWPKTRRIVGWTTAIVVVLELAIISLQAWRGTTSHFNVGTVLDATLFSTMGLGIFLQTATAIALAVALWRQPFVDRAMGWALRFGLTISILGAGVGGMMTQPTPAQMAEMQATHRMPLSGAHTVGAPDAGEPSLPGIHWNAAHGDLRVPHFLGLHALQVLPPLAFALALGGTLTEDKRARLVIVAAASYAALFALLLWQALRGQAVIHPDSVTAAAFAGWVMLTAAMVSPVVFLGGRR